MSGDNFMVMNPIPAYDIRSRPYLCCYSLSLGLAIHRFLDFLRLYRPIFLLLILDGSVIC